MPTSTIEQSSQQVSVATAKTQTAKIVLTKAPTGEIINALMNVVGLVERRAAMPILSNVLITKDGESIRFTTTDLEHQLESISSLGVNTSFANVTVPARKLVDILKTLPVEATTTLTLDGERIVVTCAKSRFTLATLPAADFPVVEKSAFDVSITLKQRELRNIIGQVKYNMATNDVRYYLNGMLLAVGNGSVTVVATDGHRLALARTHVPESVDQREVILAAKVVHEIHHLLNESDDEVEMKLSARQVSFSFDNLTFTARLIEGKFPDYKRVIPANTAHTVTFDRNMLLCVLKRGQLMASDKVRGATLTFKQDSLQVDVGNGEESVSDEIGIDYLGPDLTIGINVDYLVSALGNITVDLVDVGLRGGSDSILITERSNPEFRAVIMPMRV